jgi:hypothetical protein
MLYHDDERSIPCVTMQREVLDETDARHGLLSLGSGTRDQHDRRRLRRNGIHRCGRRRDDRLAGVGRIERLEPSIDNEWDDGERPRHERVFQQLGRFERRRRMSPGRHLRTGPNVRRRVVSLQRQQFDAVPARLLRSE